MLRIENMSYAIGDTVLFREANAVIPAGHKVGIVGRNGAGKTTLFRLIRGELSPYGGTISLPDGARIGGVAQEVPSSGQSVLATVLAEDHERAALLDEAATARDPARIAEVQTRLADIDAWSAEARAASVLRGLGFGTREQEMPCSAFSGGWRMRIALAGVLFARPDYLLLDEPSNYLDLEGALWLQNYLRDYPFTVLIISHDRALLDHAVGGILHVDQQKLTFYVGGYSQFARQLAERRLGDVATARRVEARRAHLQKFVDRFRYKASKARQAQSRLKMLEKLAPVTLAADPHVAFAFPEPEELSPPILAIEGGVAGYGGPPVLAHLALRIDQDDRIALLGRNGEGKSTLARLLAGRLAPVAGRITRAAHLRIGYFAQHQVDELHLDETPVAHVRRARPDDGVARMRARLAGFGLMAEQAEIPVARLSGGQKARLALLLATIDAPHLLILDEPTNHLDIESRAALITALNAYSGAVVIISHDMHLLSHVADRLWLVHGGRVRPYDGDLDDYRRLQLAPPTQADARHARPRPSRTRKAADETAAHIATLKSAVRRNEERLERLAEMREKLSARLADPALYEDARKDELARWSAKFAELEDAEHRAEKLWMAAQERLEAATGTHAGRAASTASARLRGD